MAFRPRSCRERSVLPAPSRSAAWPGLLSVYRAEQPAAVCGVCVYLNTLSLPHTGSASKCYRTWNTGPGCVQAGKGPRMMTGPEDHSGLGNCQTSWQPRVGKRLSQASWWAPGRRRKKAKGNRQHPQTLACLCGPTAPSVTLWNRDDPFVRHAMAILLSTYYVPALCLVPYCFGSSSQ